MGWDNLPGTGRGVRPRVSLAAALREEFPGVVAVDASLSRGRAYLAVRGDDQQIRPCYLLLDRFDDSDEVFYKIFPNDESPLRWPMKVAQVLSTWEP
jgi:hypothetical protein